ncbi:ATP-binding protein [Succinimonas amylolytica]|uniref:ATP-binding protein n=1 Tax=Succinimonas amylolytica TaxID=83769 RepID=UPI0003783D56|nr:ATP-binding protein [Succinimonas amylolytica]
MIVEKEFNSDIESLNDIQDFISQTAKNCDIPENIILRLNICTDEIVSNIIKFSEARTLSLKFVSGDDGRSFCSISYIDNGKPFNPVTEAKELDTSVPLEDREEGGMGVFIVKKMTKSVTYERDGNLNIFTISI